MKYRKIWIVSGPSCVGKSEFLWNKKNRLSEITNLPPFKGGVEAGAIKAADWDDGNVSMYKNICIHMELIGKWKQQLQGVVYHKKWKQISELKIQKSVIILGAPYSEYKVRVNSREKRPHVSEVFDTDSSTLYVDLYKNWIGELNKKEIPYLLVEAMGDYRILEEDDFFRMLK